MKHHETSARPASFHRVPSRASPPRVALFGIGWGLGRLCPGPGIVSAAGGSLPALAFVTAMLAGMYAEYRSSTCAARYFR
jgi:hypothetical protein